MKTHFSQRNLCDLDSVIYDAADAPDILITGSFLLTFRYAFLCLLCQTDLVQMVFKVFPRNLLALVFTQTL